MGVESRVGSVLDLLGGTVLPGEYRGDLGTARRAAESGLAGARASGDPALLADALIARASVHVAQGEPAAARALLDEVPRVVPGDANRQFRAVSWLAMGSTVATNLFPGGMAAEGFERSRQQPLDLEATIQRNQHRARIASHVSDGNTILEYALVHEFAAALPVWRWIVASSAPFGAMLDGDDKALQATITARNDAAGVGAGTGAVASMDLQIADMLRLAGRVDEARQLLARLDAGFGGADDAAGRAACLLLAGDWQLAPHASPLTWDLRLTERSPGSGVPDFEPELHAPPAAEAVASARSFWTQAEAFFEDAGEGRGVAAVALRRAAAAAMAEDHASALGQIDAAIAGFEATEDRLGVHLARAHRAVILIGCDRFPEERQVAESIAAWASGEGSASYGIGIGLFLSHVGWRWLLRDGRYERALACFRLARTVFGGLGARLSEAQAHMDLGLAHGLAGEQVTALVYLDQTFERYESLLNGSADVAEPAWVGAAHVVMAMYNTRLGLKDAEGVRREAERMRDLIDRKPVPPGEDPARWEPGSVAPQMWQITQDAIERMVATARVMVPLGLGQAARDDGDDEAMRRWFDETREAARDASPFDRLMAEVSIAAAERRFDDAARLAEQLVAVYSGGDGVQARIMSLMRGMFGERGQQELRRQQLRVGELAATAFANVRAWRRARQHLDELERLGGAEWWRADDRPWEQLAVYGRVCEGLGEYPAALRYFRQGIELVEERRGGLVRDDLKAALAGDPSAQDLYLGASRVALRLGDAEASFELSERGRARALLDLMAGTVAYAGAPTDAAGDVQAWREAGAQVSVLRQLLGEERAKASPSDARVADLEARLLVAEAALREIEERLARSDDGAVAAMQLQAETLSAEDVRRLLDPGTAMIAYAYAFDDLLVWTITRDSPVEGHLLTVEARLLDRDIRALHAACARGLSIDGMAAGLAEQLLAPVGGAIRAHERLLIVPWGGTTMLPFDVLPWEGGQLGATRPISYLPSASALQFVGRGGRRPDRVLAVGNPARMAHQPPGRDAPVALKPLPWSATEASYVASLFDGSEVLTDAEATENAVRARIADYRWLHFATHGYLSDTAPLLSAVVLADGASVTVYELMGLHLTADLVVLSACDTGAGVATRGGELLGLTRGLLAAGARSAVVSLWPVDDASTSLLMGAFYREIKKGADPARALQKAKAYLRGLDAAAADAELAKLEASPGIPMAAPVSGLRDLGGEEPETWTPYNHPRQWAPFILVGG